MTNTVVEHRDGNKYLILETCSHSDEMLVLRMPEGQTNFKGGKAYHYYNGVFTPVDLTKDRADGCYFAVGGTIHNWVE